MFPKCAIIIIVIIASVTANWPMHAAPIAIIQSIVFIFPKGFKLFRAKIVQGERNKVYFNCRAAAYLLQRYCPFPSRATISLNYPLSPQTGRLQILHIRL